MEEETAYKELIEKIESTAGRKMRTPRDFDYLSTQIFNTTKQYLSAITLKRFWGYIGKERKTKPYLNTLNIMSEFAGYINFDNFCKQSNGNIESYFINNQSLQTNTLEKGCHVTLMWQPDRCITIRYEGMGMFRVTESTNSKLCAGDTFFCDFIIENEPLFLRCLVHQEGAPTNYVCGKINGVKFKVMR
jgi:hypothetical protein